MSRTTDHREGRASVKIVYYTYQANADGTHTFYVRIIKNRKNVYVATGLTLHPKYYNVVKGEIRRNYPEPHRDKLVAEIARWQKKYDDAARVLEEEGLSHTAKDVADRVAENRVVTAKKTLIAYCDEVISGLRAGGQAGNAEVYQGLRNRLSAYLGEHNGGKDIALPAVTVKFCNQFERWMRGNGNSENTMHNKFRTLRAVLNRAISDQEMPVDTYPFARTVADRHKFSVSKFDTTTQKRAISRDDVRKIEAYTPQPDTAPYHALRQREWRLYLAKHLFLFSFYTGGMNFVDLSKLRWRDIETGSDGQKRVVYTRQKTKGKFSPVLLAPALTILDYYRADTHSGPDSYIFPVLSTDTHITPKSVINRLKKMIGYMNEDLKTIAEECNITTNLTTYVARHTFATSLRRAGVADAVTSQLMGHSSEKQTSVYLDEFGSDETDTAMNALL